MRNATLIDQQYVVTVDNAGCIGEKEQDVVKASNELTSYYCTRVGLLEQWCAGSHPTHLFLSNFTSEEAWKDYEKGIQKAFDEIGEKMPPLSGSTETNFESLQSGISLMMVGKVIRETSAELCEWFIIGKPLVGQDVIDNKEQVASLSEIYVLLKLGIIETIWPVGSKGIGAELERLFSGFNVECSLPLDVSSGPATCVIVGVRKENVNQLEEHITAPIQQIKII
jgi:hypothetical protein